LKGVPFIYQGQEIGQTAAQYEDIACFDDVESKNTYRDFCMEMSPEEALEKINFGSRDNARHPMAWHGGKGGGFTNGDTTWIPLHNRYKEINLANDLTAEKSVFRFYQELLKMRKNTAAFLDGAFEMISGKGDEHFIFTRTTDEEQWAVVCNFDKAQEIRLPFACEEASLSSLGRKNADGAYAPYECAVFKVKK